MGSIKDSLTFDDVTLVPQYSSVLPSETVTVTKLARNLDLKIPLMSSAMDTVTESKMAIAISKSGGMGIIHRNLSIEEQVREVKKVKKNNYLVGAAIGVSPKDLERAKELSKVNTDLIVIDTAHGHTQKVLEMIRKIKKKLKTCTLCVGNIATGKAAKFLADSGVDIVKVGIGPGSICTTRLVAGIGVPQLSAVIQVKKALKNYKTKIISDGGIKFSGDIAKAIAAGADAVMIGSLFSGTIESPGKIFKHKGKLFKNFRGMGSVGAMSVGSADRYYQKKFKNVSKYVPEGVEGIVRFKGPVDKIIYNLVGGLKSSMGYLGAKTIQDLQKKGEFVKITKAGFYESMVHSVDHVKSNEPK
ncbi:MAG: IMP dehydrogenase [Pelagibacteraceae bacterium]|nr:IMP dehydrogenase [Pelagibacteraceae bacterium]